jgi:hypothetical protein
MPSTGELASVAAMLLIFFALGAAVLGALVRTDGATLLVAAAYTTAVLSIAGFTAKHDDSAMLIFAALILFPVAGAAGLSGHDAGRFLRRWLRRRSLPHGARG